MSKLVDLTGMKFKKITVKERYGVDNFKKSTWLCDCDCGNKDVIITGRCLTEGITTSCSRCYEIEAIGKKFSRFTILQYSHNNDHGTPCFLCECECGNKKIISMRELIRGTTKSCGCLKKEHLLKLNKRDYGEASFNRTLARYKRQAKERGFEFNLTKEEFKELCEKDCHYCGAKPSNIDRNYYGKGDFLYNGIDRVNSSLGYNKENTVSCCYMCNRGKSTLTVKDFTDWVVRVYNHISTTEGN